MLEGIVKVCNGLIPLYRKLVKGCKGLIHADGKLVKVYKAYRLPGLDLCKELPGSGTGLLQPYACIDGSNTLQLASIFPRNVPHWLS